MYMASCALWFKAAGGTQKRQVMLFWVLKNCASEVIVGSATMKRFRSIVNYDNLAITMTFADGVVTFFSFECTLRVHYEGPSACLVYNKREVRLKPGEEHFLPVNIVGGQKG
jgi:hypothetical protein